MLYLVSVNTTANPYKLIRYFIATIWLINGLFCKVLNLIPRHQNIVAEILGSENSRELTILIGVSESCMAIWIVSGIWSRVNSFIQIFVIASMNIMEFVLVPELLLWGRGNAIFACLLMLVIFVNDFHLKREKIGATVC